MNTCKCKEGFSGQFCEHIQGYDELLFLRLNNTLIFDTNGITIEKNLLLENNLLIHRACSTIFYGEAILFGGDSNPRQVRLCCRSAESLIVFQNLNSSFYSDFNDK